jgi:hypothetical protein
MLFYREVDKAIQWSLQMEKFKQANAVNNITSRGEQKDN